MNAPSSNLFTGDFTTDPYWWEASPRLELQETPLPTKVDVLVVGSGYTGLNAALVTARAGRSTLVLEKDRVGEGCSTRNGGQISSSVKPSLAELSRHYGPKAAQAILSDGREALRWIGEFTSQEGIDCDFSVCGRFHAAHSPKAFEAMRRDASNQQSDPAFQTELVSRAEQHREIGTDAYHGGVLLPHHAVLDPGRYHSGLLNRVRDAGAIIIERCAAVGIARSGTGFVVETPRGHVIAREVIIATNGYTGKVTPWLRRRVVLIGSYVIATESIPRDLMKAVIPRGRIVEGKKAFPRAAPCFVWPRRIFYFTKFSPRLASNGRYEVGQPNGGLLSLSARSRRPGHGPGVAVRNDFPARFDADDGNDGIARHSRLSQSSKPHLKAVGQLDTSNYRRFPTGSFAMKHFGA